MTVDRPIGGVADSSDFVGTAPEYTPAQLSGGDQEVLRTFRQGDVIAGLTTLVIVGDDGGPHEIGTPLGVVIISQTCDVVLPNRPTVQVAKRVHLIETAASDARDGKRPRYVHLPALGEKDFADLEVITTVTKPTVARLSRLPGVESDDEMRRFGRAVARRFGRFPFPDEVTPWLRPLEEVVSSRTRKSASPEGQALREVVELRVEATGGWRAAPYDLTLVVVVEPGALPAFPGDDLPELPNVLRSWLYGADGASNRSSSEIAGRLVNANDAGERYWLWMALAEAWAARCYPKGAVSDSVLDAVRSIEGEVVQADEFPLTRVRRSEQLDLDHLSAPTPE